MRLPLCHLGHFALTCQLGDKIIDRVISVSSAMYVLGRIHLDDLNWHTREYSMWAAYEQSKLATMLFINELARRGVRAYASDPGMADSGITRDSTGGLHWLGEHLLSTSGRARPTPREPPSRRSRRPCPAEPTSRHASTSGANLR